MAACGSSQPAASQTAARGAAAAHDLPRATKTLEIERPPLTGGGRPAPVLEVVQAELARALAEFGKQETAPYYLAYHVDESVVASVEANEGMLVDSTAVRSRSIDVDVRVGTHQLDNTHGDIAQPFLGSVQLPLGDDPMALRVPIWLGTESAYQHALEALIEVRAAKEVQAEEEDDSPDFSQEQPVRHLEEPATLTWDRAAWEQRVRELSAVFRDHPEIERSLVRLHAGGGTRYFTSSEGALVQTPRRHVWIAYGAQLTAEDGTVLSRYDDAYATTVDGLPDQAELTARIQSQIEELVALRDAPQGQPYVGPVLLDGMAAAVLVHEVLGHRVEGHRLKNDWEGQTFAKKVGERVMPAGFAIYDDPSVHRINGTRLNGFYAFDDEGVRGGRASVVEDGVFRGFLMSRTPIRGFLQSNGHGRKQPGFRVVSRQGNLIVDPERVTTREALHRALIVEVERQGLPYGIRISRVTGGVTQTTAQDPQAFQLDPVMVYQVFPDGREQLIRGVTLEGTPLSLLASIIGAGNDFAVFNGLCGAESGEIPVSAVSPSLLVSRLEVARASKLSERPPLLPPPAVKGEGG